MGCAATTTQPARIYKESGLAKPGTYHLRFQLNGQGSLAEYLRREKTRNPDLREFDVSGLMKLFVRAYPQLYLPVQPGVPLCNLETNFKHCRGIELLADFETYADDTVVLESWVLYHIMLRLEKEQPNFFNSARAQRDRGEFALPRRYYVGALVEAIQKALPILQEIATDYRKYIKEGDQEIEIELTLEESREKVAARESDRQMKDAGAFGSGVIVSVLPGISFITGLTISALHSGGRTFWEVLREEKEFEISRRRLDLEDVEFSYTESFSNNFSHILIQPPESTSDIIIREIAIRLRPKEKRI
ncbi:MAG: hypothetical protein LLG97_00210 [Deltaproteobacteria bacterium]|nr:hypothetical protein [Deltaproteobacteria bacterium]